MAALLKPRTAEQNGPLWGARARDWADLMETLFRPVYAVAFDLAGIDGSTRLVDVGCGSGLAIQLARQRGATVSGLDASAELLAIARERCPDVRLELGDLESLPFEDGSADVVSGFNSFQYAGNPASALGEARRVARPGGQVLITTWGPPDAMEAASLVLALKPLLPPPPPGAPGPFALSEESVLRAFAADSALRPQEIRDVTCHWTFVSEALAVRGLKSSGVGVRAVATSGEPAVDQAHRAALAPFRAADGSYGLTAIFRILRCAV